MTGSDDVACLTGPDEHGRPAVVLRFRTIGLLWSVDGDSVVVVMEPDVARDLASMMEVKSQEADVAAETAGLDWGVF